MKIISNTIPMMKEFYQLCIIVFNENKYPSTNIKMDIFEEHINIIKNSDF